MFNLNRPCSLNICFSLLFNISNIIGKKDPNTTLFYVMLETYSSLLAENDIPSIRNVFSQVLPVVFEHKAWGILHNLLEMFSYRLPFIPQNYRVHLMSLIHSIAAIPQTNQNYQLHLCLESTAFCLIQGLENHVVESYFTKHKPNMLVSAESEELNRIFILNIARAIHISGTEQHSSQWYDDILKTIVEKTPMNWSKHTLEHFPLPIQNFLAQRIIPVESKPALKQRVEEEYVKFKNMKSQAEILNYFGEPGSPNIFVCIIWKCLLESGRVNQICLQVLVKLGARALTKQIRVFSDFLIYDYSIITSEEITKRTGCLHDMVWKYHIFTIDRLVLCLVLRYYESKEAQVCNLLVTFLLLKNPSFRERVQTFVQEPMDAFVHDESVILYKVALVHLERVRRNLHCKRSIQSIGNIQNGIKNTKAITRS
ncbi:mediator of RNA polymerase II transcription subunit 23-like isoform X2 [Xenia sp. Carnegie-2017]|uniref:mediator of RNA polymerase II transcription subunit 23-like isoform X2 n=1 Tax=Xenia sp. Carnegie-2017 TaxID=2897299 RepID=UPI001F045DEF|nr:mediator of RNA polymerase II transcription subunit 23-like isoform X2 [Xenia sp. Carnegie-2017]